MSDRQEQELTTLARLIQPTKKITDTQLAN